MGTMCSSCGKDTPSVRSGRGRDPLLKPEKKNKIGGETNESDVEDNSSTPQSFNLENMGDSLFEDLARFLRTLPPKSKQHIWEHGVKIKLPDGKKQVCDTTKDKDQINRLLCDCVIVYVKYLDRNRAPLSTKKVKPHVEQVALYIHTKYHPLQRDKFETNKNYFASILEDYVYFASILSLKSDIVVFGYINHCKKELKLNYFPHDIVKLILKIYRFQIGMSN
eukprot:413159_1